MPFLRIEFICIIWTEPRLSKKQNKFLRIEFICIIWTGFLLFMLILSSWGLNLFVLFELSSSTRGTILVLEDWIYLYYLNKAINILADSVFLRIEFICIIWTTSSIWITHLSSWGLNLFVLFEQKTKITHHKYCSWGLNLFVLFEHLELMTCHSPGSWGLNLFVLFELPYETLHIDRVLEDWIYLYYLNNSTLLLEKEKFLRIEFICIIWTCNAFTGSDVGSWGLNLFVLFEHLKTWLFRLNCSWGLNLFVLFERIEKVCFMLHGSWGLNLFVLFELQDCGKAECDVLEDWIYLYYLNHRNINFFRWWFLRIEFICIIWTCYALYIVTNRFLRIEFICIIWTCECINSNSNSSWGLNLFVLFEPFQRIDEEHKGSWGLNLFVLFEQYRSKK